MFHTRRVTAAVTATIAAVGLTAAAVAAPVVGAPNNNSARKLTNAVTPEAVLEHLSAFQDISDDNGGNRAAGLPGYAASVDYVVETLEAAGYEPTVQEFPFQFFEENSELVRVSPIP